MIYRIVPEFHVSPEIYYDVRTYPSVQFQYAIRRKDDSLVFRTETHQYAAEILSNLEYPKKVRAAA